MLTSVSLWERKRKTKTEKKKKRRRFGDQRVLRKKKRGPQKLVQERMGNHFRFQKEENFWDFPWPYTS